MPISLTLGVPQALSGGIGTPGTSAEVLVETILTLTSQNVATNESVVHWEYRLREYVNASPFNNNAGSSGSLTVNSPVWSSGSLTYNFDGTNETIVYASGDITIAHNSDGTKSFTASGAFSGQGGTPLSSGSFSDTVTLPTLLGVPSAPTGLAAAWVSDTSIDVTWSQSSPGNSQPTTNEVEQRINGGAWASAASVAPTTTVSIGSAANRKTEYRVRGVNAAGASAWSAVSAPVYTTPAAPSSVVATKVGSDIVITFAENVAYSEYEHEIWHGTITGGVTTWDGSALTTLASGDLDHTHTAPNPAQVHVYRVRAKAGARLSGYVTSNSVQLLTAPAKPTVPALAAFADKASVFRLPWVHNPLDSSAQTKYQWRWSTNGGSSWTTGSKTTSVNQYHDFAASTWTANQAVTFQVRTKGQYDSGSDGDASYSPWSDSVTVTFKTVPVTTITTPANASVDNDSTLVAVLGFSQAEGATFVKAQFEVVHAAVVIETKESVTQAGTTMATVLQNGESYTLRARSQDSNGLWSAWVTSTFSVSYTLPVPAGVVLTYLENTGWGQIDLSIPAPGGGQAAATLVSITRSIDGGDEEVVVTDYPVSATLTFLDTIPTIHGTNTYTVTTKSAIGATSVVVEDLVTEECRRAFLSKGIGYTEVGVFGGNLSVDEDLVVASDTFQAAGRTKPIGQYGVETEVQLKVSSLIFENFGSTVKELRAVLLVPGKACYRDASGRRVFGAAKGGVSYKKSARGEVSFTLKETS